jgi:peptidoglycan/LPS O-acetylase OafA/YrhL
LPEVLHWAFAPVIAAAALAVAYGSYRVIETPFNRLAHRLTRRPMRQAALAE